MDKEEIKGRIRRIFAFLLLLVALMIFLIVTHQIGLYKDSIDTLDAVTEEYTSSDKEFTIDWEGLWKINPDIIGWIVMDSGANYPVVIGETNNTYLHTDIYGNYSINGSIFMSSYCDRNWLSPNSIVYGHNMNNGSMFGSNHKYDSKDYFEEHPMFTIYTPRGKYDYHIFNVKTVTDASDVYNVDFADLSEYEQWLSETDSVGNNYETGVDVPENTRIVSLSTCAVHGTKRLVIRGYLENIEDYKSQIYARRGVYDSTEAFYDIIEDDEEENTEEITEDSTEEE